MSTAVRAGSEGVVMQGLIALEEHFALPETLGDSQQYAVAGGWSDLERGLLDLDDLRIAVATFGRTSR